MMAGLNCLYRRGVFLHMKSIPQIQQAAMSSELSLPEITRIKIGTREVLGYGLNGEPSYIDMLACPLPSVRFKEDTPEILILRDKEKGDWKKLTLEEKKQLYRASFCRTLSEVNAPTGQWKSTIGYVLMFMSLSIWLFILQKNFVNDPYPVTFEPKRQKAQLQKMIDLRLQPIDGPASKWDYEKGRWKE